MAKSFEKNKTPVTRWVFRTYLNLKTSIHWIDVLKTIVIAVAVTAVFAPALHGDWSDDDHFYFDRNPLQNDPDHGWKIWFKPGSFIEYYPITESIQMLQWHLWHNDSFGYISSNIGLHILNALLVWHILSKLRLRLAWLGGLLFALHPMAVESVAWISELKNTLSLFPFLLAMSAWIDYEETWQARYYWTALGLFLIAMLCKISMAPFPIVILLYAWWKRGRLDGKDWKGSLPFFAMSLILGLTTVLAGNGFAQLYPTNPPQVPLGGLSSRLALAGLSIAFYFSKFFVPLSPSIYYFQWNFNPPTLVQFLPWLVLSGLFYWSWKERRRWGRHVVLGLGFFILFLAPFIGFTETSYMQFTWVMDHFLYIPMIGLIGLVVAGADHANSQLPREARPWAMTAAALAILLLAVKTNAYAKTYADKKSLFTYALQLNPASARAHRDLGRILSDERRLPEAFVQFQQALEINSIEPDCHFYFGTALMQANRLHEAIQQLEEAIRLDPAYADAYDNLGAAQIQLGHSAEAQASYRRALDLSPRFAQAHNDLGNAYLQEGQISAAIIEFQKTVDLQPDAGMPHDNLAIALIRANRIPDAIAQFRAALQLNPQDETAQQALEQLLKGSVPSH